MSGVPRLLPMVAVAIGGVLAMKAVSGLEAAPSFLKQAKAYAEEPAPGERPAGPAPSAKPVAGPLPADAASATDATAPTAAKGTPVCAAPAGDLAKEAGLSPAELRVLQSLQSRRGELDQRAQALDTQTALLDAAGAKLDGKIKALNDLKAQIQGLLGQADQQQDAEMQRLVKVYESMKPKDAAAVLSRLDDRVRLPVASRMKERALAAVLAQMSPEEARKLTEKLATRFSADALAQKVADANAAPKPGTKTPARAG